ncbi:hypothetical protein QBC34DRAFT_460252 [Podospora aff. communis PSN243]|uniref:N-acetyltransferase domain-containing protein n=1 Tax=Podospora aff. communis PSN243 TaxID=3040156 RepID=A0AAV9H4K8_9PEZI|nr:hypothetical protein QBC34DRAFT_460252 [Podospora aff. communis PSN243]
MTSNSRFQVRPLLPEHIPWARVIITHSNIFHSPVWPILYPTDLTCRAYAFFTASEKLMTLNTLTGLSYGLFDTQYTFKHPSSIPTGGKLHWDLTNTAATPQELLHQMDFPLVSIAMAHDAAEPRRDGSEWKEVIDILPRLATLFGEVEKNDERDEGIWKPKVMGEVIYRGGTSTRADYEGLGCAKMLAHACMREWKGRGYRGMQVGVAHPAVVRIFTEGLPQGMRGSVVARLDTRGYEEVDAEGGRVRPFEVVHRWSPPWSKPLHWRSSLMVMGMPPIPSSQIMRSAHQG